MKVFVSPPESPGAPLADAAAFESALRLRWPGAVVERPTSPSDTHALDWSVAMQHGMLVGSFGKDGETLICEGDVRDCAEVARWFRAMVPRSQPLVFFDEGYTESVELAASTTADELAAPFLA